LCRKHKAALNVKMPDTKIFEQEITLSSHSVPPRSSFPAKLAYWTIGDSSKPVVLLPTCYGGSLSDTSPFLYSGDTAIFSDSEYFIIVTALLGGGESSSPSNTPAPFDGPNFPRMTYEDNIRLQHALCEHLGVSRLFAYIGFSMGGQQAYHMSVLYPDFAEHMVCIAGSARTSWHNWSFLEGPRYALTTGVDFHDGHYTEPALKSVRAFFRVYSTWALSPEWFRHRCWEQAGFPSLEAYLEENWSGGGDANDLLALLWTWQKGDITLYHPEDGNDLSKTLRRIKTKCLIMPTRTDQYFPPEDNEEEIEHLQHGTFRCVDTVWGHIAGGGGGTDGDTEYIACEIAEFLKFPDMGTCLGN
jgi:homoserine O-acetyltransferase